MTESSVSGSCPWSSVHGLRPSIKVSMNEAKPLQTQINRSPQTF